MPEGLLEVDVGAGGGIAPVLAPPDGQQEQEHGVAHHAVVVRDCNIDARYQNLKGHPYCEHPWLLLVTYRVF